MNSLKQSSPKNTSGFHPKGRAVLVLPHGLENELKSRGSKIVVPDTASQRLKMMDERGLLIEVGAAAWQDEPEPRARPGEIVLMSKWCGNLFTSPVDGLLYKMCNCDDIYGTLDEEFVEKLGEVA